MVQRNVLMAAFVLAIVMALIPPWEAPDLRDGSLGSSVNVELFTNAPVAHNSMGYHPLFSPPKGPLSTREATSWGEISSISMASMNHDYQGVISWTTLAIQYVILVLITFTVLMMLRQRQPAT